MIHKEADLDLWSNMTKMIRDDASTLVAEITALLS